MKKRKYDYLHDIYPEIINKLQLSQICRISPRSALYLLEHKIIPFSDNGKKTWRYKIALADVITYLRKREQVGSMIPCGSVSSKGKYPENPRKSFSMYVDCGLKSEMEKYFKYIFADYPDILSATSVADMTGLSKKTILRYISLGHLKSLGIGRNNNHIIPKQYVLEFVVSAAYIDCISNSEKLKKIIGGFEIWITVK